MPSHQFADTGATQAALAAVGGATPSPAMGPAAVCSTSSPPCDTASLPRELLCNPGAAFRGWLAELLDLARAWSPQLTAIATVAVPAAVIAVGVSGWVRHEAWRRAAMAARWVEIQPPPQPSRDAALAFWHTIAAMLNRTRRHPLAPQVLGMEIVATDKTTRLGIWVPPALSAASVVDAVTSAWPTAGTRITDRPTLIGARRARAVDLSPRGGAWAPLIHSTGRAHERDTAEPLGPLLTRLADRRTDQISCVQLLLTPDRRRTTNTVEETGVGRLPLVAALTVLQALCRVLLWVIDLFLTTSHRTSGRSQGRAGDRPENDAVSTAKQRLADAKRAHGPHLHASLRVALASPRGPRHQLRQRRRRRNLVAALAGGYDPVARAAELDHTRTRHAAWHVITRRPSSRGFWATVDELAALWHLPTHAAQYRITETPGRAWDPRHDLPRIPRHHHNDAHGDDRADQRPGDDDAA